MVTAWCENSGGPCEVGEGFLKDPELRQRHLPARGMLLNNLCRNQAKFYKTDTKSSKTFVNVHKKNLYYHKKMAFKNKIISPFRETQIHQLDNNITMGIGLQQLSGLISRQNNYIIYMYICINRVSKDFNHFIFYPSRFTNNTKPAYNAP